MAIELRKTGIKVLGDVPWGTHFCHFYETKQDLLDTLVPYFKAGLENKEQCLWAVSHPEVITLGEAREALAQAVGDLDRHLAAEDIEIVNGLEWYLENEVFDLERVTRGWDARLKRALALGYDGLRVSGDTFWLGREQWKEFSVYEKQLNDFIADLPMTLFCTYPLMKSGAVEILDVVGSHQVASAIRQGKWQVIESPAMVQAKAEIKQFNSEFEQRVAKRTGELASTNEELQREVTERKRAEDQLRRQKEILQKIFDNVPSMIAALDADEHVVLANREWERTIGWSIAELAEQNLEILAECFPDPQYRQQARHFLSAANGRWDDFKVSVRDGRTLDVTAAVVRLSDGTRLAIGQDISERKQAEEQLTITSEQLRKLSASLQSAREEEGIRIARELHDELGATLSSLRWDLEYALEVVCESSDLAPLTELRKRIAAMIKLADTTLSSVRRIVAELRPIGLDELGLSEAVEWQARQFQERTGIVVECDCALEDIDLSHQQLIAVFRIFQEGLTNILRHAQATKVSIQIVEEKGELILTIKDNGRGITEEEKSGKRTLGLLGMRERAHLIGGKVDITGVEREGTQLTVKIPLPAKLARATG